MKRPLALITVLALAAAASAATPDVPKALTHIDAILHETAAAKAKLAAQTRELTLARAQADARDAAWREQVKTAEQSAAAWQAEYESVHDSWAYWLGAWALRLFWGWVIALGVVFALRLACVWVGGPVGQVLAMVSTWGLHVLTFGLSLTTNIPDNLYFGRKVARLNETVQDQQLQIAAMAGSK